MCGLAHARVRAVAHQCAGVAWHRHRAWHLGVGDEVDSPSRKCVAHMLLVEKRVVEVHLRLCAYADVSTRTAHAHVKYARASTNKAANLLKFYISCSTCLHKDTYTQKNTYYINTATQQ